MANLRTINEAEAEAIEVVRSYKAWESNEAVQIFEPATGEEPFAIAIKAGGDKALRLAARARRVLARSDANKLSQDYIDDLTEIAEELELAASEAEAITRPEQLFASQDEEKKRKLTERVTIPREQSGRLLSRIKRDLRAQHGGHADTPGNNPKK